MMNLGNLTARDVMNDDCMCVNEHWTVREAAVAMCKQQIGALPICGDNEKLIGMLTDRDIVVKCVAEGRSLDACTVSEVCTKPIVWVRDDASMRDVLDLMEEHRIRRVPVIDSDKRLAGIISESDIAHNAGLEPAGELAAALAH
jgi:CBS domain-containing protein